MKRLCGAAPLLLGVLSLVESASAQTFWVADDVGNWNLAANWSAGVPTVGAHAQINNGGTARLFDPSAVTNDLTLGANIASIGTLEVIGGEATIGDDLWVGSGGTGTLSIAGGGVVSNPNGDIEIGRSSGSTGTVTVDGAGSRLQDAVLVGQSGAIFVGGSGTGAVMVTNGGTVSSFGSHIARNPDSNGTVTVDGPGSNWTLYGTFFNVGLRGVGTLDITGGGRVSDADATIGLHPGSSGTATIVGAGSTWANAGILTVGEFGDGTLGISAGGLVSNTDALIGVESGSQGMVAIDGATSRWTNTSVLAVGVSGTGSLSVANGAVVTSINGRIGREVGSTGAVVIDGSGSQWNCTGVFTVASVHPGGSLASLTVRNGGALSALGGLTVNMGGAVRGVGSIAANVANNWIVEPGSPTGALQVTGNYTQSGGANLVIGLASATEHARLTVSGNAGMGGVLDVRLVDGYAPAPGASFDILDWGTRTGNFSSVVLPTLPTPLAWNTSQLYTQGILSVTSPFRDGDFDEDHDVDNADLARWRMNFGATTGATHLQGDSDFDGDVDGRDFLVWQQQNGSGPLASAVPEPMGSTLWLLVLATVSRRRPFGG